MAQRRHRGYGEARLIGVVSVPVLGRAATSSAGTLARGRSVKIKLMLPLFALAILALSGAAPAWADLRAGSIDDPRDTPQDINGNYNHQDIQQVRVSYDTGGALSASVRFFAPVRDYSESGSSFQLSLGEYQDGAYSYCGAYNNGDAHLTFTPQRQSGGEGSITISGLEGSIPATRSISADGYEVTVQATHPALANKGYNCVSGPTNGYSYENFHCTDYGCYDYSYYEIDGTGDFKLYGPGGYTAPAPPPPDPQCSDGIDNDGDGQIDDQDWGCDTVNDNDEHLEILPSLTAKDTRRYIRRGLRQKHVPLGAHMKFASCSRLSRVRVRCSVSWRARGATWRGPVTIWYSKDGEEVAWNFAYPLTKRRLNCHRRCVRHYVVR